MLRAATKQDLPELLALEEKLFPNAMGERLLQHELTRGCGWLALVDGVVAGYVLVRRDDDLLDITRLGVHEEFRGRGLGRELLEKVLKEHFDVMLTVKKDNVKAIRLYRTHGFTIVGHLIAAEAWVMRATLVDS